MWRAILVDDEKFVRVELKKLFPWNRYRFELVGEAENARTAKELIEATQPDVVITDIRMPEMDGLELISWIGLNHPRIATAVVSAYNDFPFVREALRLGAVDYLMKAEATFESAGAFLERIGGILDQRDSVQRRQTELINNIASYQRLAIESFWRDMLTRSLDKIEIDSQAQQLGIVLEQSRFGLIFIHISDYYARKAEQQPALRTTIEEKIQSNWNWNWAWNLIDFKRGNFVIVVSSTGETPEPEAIEKLQDIARRLALESTEKWTTSAASSIGSFDVLPGVFREVREVNLLRLYHQEGRYFETGDLLRLRQAAPPKLPELLAAWERILREKELNVIRNFLKSIFENILPQSLRPEEARWLVLDLIHTLYRVALEQQWQREETGQGERDLPEILEQAESLSDWQKWLEKLAREYLQSAQTNIYPPGTLAIRKALEYIQSNFTQSISLEEVADFAGVNKSYLSRVFPEYAGDHFSNYLQRLRIERAKELLRFTDDHIYEIAAKVGFWNSRYFSKVFHDIVGMTPADYRRIT